MDVLKFLISSTGSSLGSITMPKKTTAVTRVCTTPELLENILLHLPLTDLLLSQRVNKTWQNMVTGSPALQQALFLRSATLTPLISVGIGDRILDCQNAAACIANDPLRLNYPHDESNGPGRWVYNVEDLSTERRPIYNPFAKRIKALMEKQLEHSRELRIERCRERHWRDVEDEAAEMAREKEQMLAHPFAADVTAMLRPEASWRRMLVTQPPIVNMIVDHGESYHCHRLPAHEDRLYATLEELQESGARFEGRLPIVAGMIWECSLDKGVPNDFWMSSIAE